MNCENCIHYCVCDYDDIGTRANYCPFYEEKRPHENWEYLKELITDVRDADGRASKKGTCQYILNLMEVIERGR